MALSLLGVWEIPIPGFFGSGSVQEVAAQEGPLGAFLKGVVTTVLGTPCTAPVHGGRHRVGRHATAHHHT